MDKIVCPECGSEDLIKNGNRKGLQGYKCKACNKRFAFGKYEPKKKIEKEKKEKITKTDKLFDLGHRWEGLVEKILKEQEKKVERQKVLDNNRIADFMYNKKIIECKLSAGTEELLLTIQKYADYCHKIEIWSLNKCTQERISTYISKEEILKKMERKTGRWHNYIIEFEKKNINVEMLYFDDIVKKIHNEDLLNEINSMYKEYREIQPYGGRVTYFANELSMDFEQYLKDIDNSLDINNNIYINNAIRMHYIYSIEGNGTGDEDYDRNWQINGIIILKDLRKFKIPTNYYIANADDNLKECSFLELEMEYINKNTFVNYETIFYDFSLVDRNGTMYENIPGYLLDNQIISDSKTTFIQRHVADMHPNKPIKVKLYFKIPNDFSAQDLKLECRGNKEINIMQDKTSLMNNTDKSNNINQKIVNEVNKEEITKHTNKIKKDNKKWIIIALISIALILFFCYLLLDRNKSDNNPMEENIYQQEVKKKTNEDIVIEDKNDANSQNVQDYEDIDIKKSENDNKAPRLEMTKEQVLNTKWGKPDYIDYGGTVADKNNKKRTNGEWDEAWYYKRNGNKIFIDFKNNRVVKFIVKFKGDKIGSKVVYNVDNL